MPVVSITRLRVRSWSHLPFFALQTLRIALQAKKADGNLATALLRDRHNVFWTATSWSSESAMKDFMLAEPHGPTMRKLLEWCNEAALVHWTQDNAELPDWAEAHRRMLREGRSSKVHHPTAAQIAHSIAEPDPNPSRNLRLK